MNDYENSALSQFQKTVKIALTESDVVFRARLAAIDLRKLDYENRRKNVQDFYPELVWE